MVFNWFRRKFDNSESESVPDPELVEESAGAEESLVEPATAEPTTASEDIATDYLAWAKAAYQNIQQQEAPPAAVETAPEVGEPVEPAIETSDANVEEIAVETTTAESEPTPTIDALPLTTEEDAENIPIWAREDRQQRLEQLKATAIETIEPAASTADIDLDDEIGRAHV